jgi:hypothetical protein
MDLWPLPIHLLEIPDHLRHRLAGHGAHSHFCEDGIEERSYETAMRLIDDGNRIARTPKPKQVQIQCCGAG